MEWNTVERAINKEILYKNRIKRCGQARLVYVTDINRNIPTTWRWARGDYNRVASSTTAAATINNNSNSNSWQRHIASENICRSWQCIGSLYTVTSKRSLAGNTKKHLAAMQKQQEPCLQQLANTPGKQIFYPDIDLLGPGYFCFFKEQFGVGCREPEVCTNSCAKTAVCLT